MGDSHYPRPSVIDNDSLISDASPIAAAAADGLQYQRILMTYTASFDLRPS